MKYELQGCLMEYVLPEKTWGIDAQSFLSLDIDDIFEKIKDKSNYKRLFEAPNVINKNLINSYYALQTFDTDANLNVDDSIEYENQHYKIYDKFFSITKNTYCIRISYKVYTNTDEKTQYQQKIQKVNEKIREFNQANFFLDKLNPQDNELDDFC